MFSRITTSALIRGSRDCRAFRGRRTRPARRPPARVGARLQVEGLEDRCLLSGISSITEFPVPSVDGGPYDLDGIAAGPGGNLWFDEPGSNAIGMINPTTHATSSFAIPTAGSNPSGITEGPDGDVWFTEYAADAIGMLNPNTGAISSFAVPTANAGPLAITVGANGNLWFTEWKTQKIGEINPSTHAVTEFTPPSLDGLGEDDIISGPGGDLWFTTQNDGKVGMINPTTGAFEEFSVPLSIPYCFVYGIAADSEGNLWFAENASDLGVLNPTTGAITEVAIPSKASGMTTGPDGNIWFTESSAGEIGSINPTTDVITEYTAPYTGSSPTGITTGPDGNLWFTDGGTTTVGVADLTNSNLVVTQQPPSSITAGSSFGLTVTAEDSSGDPITSFNGTVTATLATNPGGATLGGTTSVTASNGAATASGLTLTTAASGYTLELSASGLAAANTSAITVTPAVATQLVITTQPPATVKVNTAFGYQASIEDQYGNVVTTATNTVSVSFANNPTGATLSGTLSVTASAGVASFSGLKINKTGSGYTLKVTSSGLSSAVTNAFNVTKTGQVMTVAAIPVTAGSVAPDALLAPLVLDSPDLWDIPSLKKRARTN